MTIQQVFALCLKRGDTCFDVGANIGMSAEVISPLVGPTGRCISFECHPLHFARLAFLASRPGFENIFPYCRALSDRPGHILLHTGSDPAVSQASTIVADLGNAGRLGNSIARLKVETDTLDRFCSAHEISPHLIKVDVEGAEAQVLAGTRVTLARCLPHLVFEFGYGFSSGKTPGHFTLLQELGYEFHLIDLFHYRNQPFVLNDAQPVLFSITAGDIARTQANGNVLAVHRAKAASLLREITVHPFAEAEPHLPAA